MWSVCGLRKLTLLKFIHATVYNFNIYYCVWSIWVNPFLHVVLSLLYIFHNLKTMNVGDFVIGRFFFSLGCADMVSVLFYNKCIRCDQNIKMQSWQLILRNQFPNLMFNLHAFTELFVYNQLPWTQREFLVGYSTHRSAWTRLPSWG